MKKLLTLVFVFAFTIAQAQKNPKAVKLANEMSKVMGLSDEDTSKVLELILDRNDKKHKLMKEYPDDKETFKSKAKMVQKEYNKKLRDLVGNEKMKLLNAHYIRKRNASKG